MPVRVPVPSASTQHPVPSTKYWYQYQLLVPVPVPSTGTKSSIQHSVSSMYMYTHRRSIINPLQSVFSRKVIIQNAELCKCLTHRALIVTSHCYSPPTAYGLRKGYCEVFFLSSSNIFPEERKRLKNYFLVLKLH